MDIIDYREAEIAKITESEDRVTALCNHLNEIIEGKSFKGSHRSGQFLKYIVDQTIAGNFEMLKERIIGSQIFGRSPSYDTGEDAIVRVTASDVRKRLLQHYDRNGTASEFRINLPLGSYIPEIIYEHAEVADPLHAIKTHPESTAAPPDSGAGHRNLAPTSLAVEEPIADSPVASSREAHVSGRSKLWWIAFAVLITAFNLALFGVSWMRFSRAKAATVTVLPWSALFSSPHATHLITSDPNIAEIQSLAGNSLPISVSDYANHNYIPEPNTLTPEIRQICVAILIGNKASAVDTQIIADVAELASSNSRKIDVRVARKLQISDLRNDDNFILLGSPRSNPWSMLFADQLDFQFLVDKGQMIIHNVRPGQGEQPFYVPTAKGGATGQTFAIIALIQNPNQNGQVLLLAGADGEGTAAAGKFVTDLPRLTTSLEKCGVSSSGPLKHFELLLSLNTIANSATTVNVAACHILPDSAVH
jgi:flagellar basal body-associated protein FliL